MWSANKINAHPLNTTILRKLNFKFSLNRLLRLEPKQKFNKQRHWNSTEFHFDCRNAAFNAFTVILCICSHIESFCCDRIRCTSTHLMVRIECRMRYATNTISILIGFSNCTQWNCTQLVVLLYRIHVITFSMDLLFHMRRVCFCFHLRAAWAIADGKHTDRIQEWVNHSHCCKCTHVAYDFKWNIVALLSICARWRW